MNTLILVMVLNMQYTTLKVKQVELIALKHILKEIQK